MNRLINIGTGGHGKVIADNALKNGYTDISFVDDHATGDRMGFSIIGMCDDVVQNIKVSGVYVGVPAKIRR